MTIACAIVIVDSIIAMTIVVVVPTAEIEEESVSVVSL